MHANKNGKERYRNLHKLLGSSPLPWFSMRSLVVCSVLLLILTLTTTIPLKNNTNTGLSCNNKQTYVEVLRGRDGRDGVPGRDGVKGERGDKEREEIRERKER
uniref:Uncharacterized protein n=1 Tax=Amphimedon queenslandica TaxID=400682 RepID=A0A1X7TF00_AMPQE